MAASTATAKVYPLNGGQSEIETSMRAWLNTLDSKRTRNTYEESVRLAFGTFRRRRASEVTVEDVAGFKRSMADRKPSTIALRLCALRSFFRFAIANGYAHTDPTLQVPVPKVNQGTPRALDFKEAKRIAEQIDTNDVVGMRDAAAIGLLFGGLRVSEVAGLNIGDIALEQQDGEAFTRVRVLGKGAKPRVVDLPARIHELVTRYIEARGGYTEPSSPMFLATVTGYSKTPERMSADRIYRQLRRYARRAKVKITGSHVGRHTWAKLAEEGGAKLMDVMAHLGHANLNVTATYLRRLSGKRNPAYACVPSVW